MTMKNFEESFYPKEKELKRLALVNFINTYCDKVDRQFIINALFRYGKIMSIEELYHVNPDEVMERCRNFGPKRLMGLKKLQEIIRKELAAE